MAIQAAQYGRDDMMRREQPYYKKPEIIKPNINNINTGNMNYNNQIGLGYSGTKTPMDENNIKYNEYHNQKLAMDEINKGIKMIEISDKSDFSNILKSRHSADRINLFQL